MGQEACSFRVTRWGAARLGREGVGSPRRRGEEGASQRRRERGGSGVKGRFARYTFGLPKGSYEVRCGGRGSADWPREHPTVRIRPPVIWSESTKTCQRLTARRVAAALRAGLFGTNDVGRGSADWPREHPTVRIRPPVIWSESTKTCQRL